MSHDTTEKLDRLWDKVDKCETTGTVEYEDGNGKQEARVEVDGEFWRVVCVYAPVGLTPDAARNLAREILHAAERAEFEELRRKDLRARYAALEGTGR